MKRFCCIFFVAVFFFSCAIPVSAAEFSGEIDAKSAVLMEASTGQVIFEKDDGKIICKI